MSKRQSGRDGQVKKTVPVYQQSQQLIRLMMTEGSDGREMARVRMACSNLLWFTQFTFSEYKANWHHSYLCEKLDQFVEGQIKRLIVLMPSRMGKTELVSIRMPAFIFGKKPDAKIIAASYGADLAQENSRKLMMLIDSEPYQQIFPDTKLFGENVRTMTRGTWLRNVDEFQVVNRQGHYKCSGVGGGLAGRGGNYLILDDPIKDDKAAQSATLRNATWNWFWSVFRQRRNTDDAGILVTATRWHQDDVVDRLLQMQKDGIGDKWEVIRFPAMAEEEREEGDMREVGEVLWPARFSQTEWENEQRSVPNRIWACMYQQKPLADEGNIFKLDSFRYFYEKQAGENGTAKRQFVLNVPAGDGTYTQKIVEESKCVWFQTADTAMKETSAADYTVVETWCLTPGSDLLLLDVYRQKLEGPKQFKELMRLRSKFGRLQFQALEDKAIGIGLIQQAATLGKPFRILKADTNKELRAADMATFYENGRVYHLSGAAWLTAYESELLSFPTGTHDDQVDCASYAGRLAMRDALLRSAVEGELFMQPRSEEHTSELQS